MEINSNSSLRISGAVRRLWFCWLIFFAVRAGAASWYVDNSVVTSANTGNSWTNAWTNLTSVSWSSIRGGDTLYISGGTYSGPFIIVRPYSTSEANRVTVRCGQDTGHTGPVTILGGIQMGDEMANAANYVTIDGSYNGQTNIFLRSGGSGAIYHRYDSETNNHYLYLDICNTNGNSQTQGIQLQNYAHGTEIGYCYIHNCQNRGIREGSAGGRTYANRISIHNCVFAQNLDDPIGMDGAAEVYNNIFDGTGSNPATHPDGIQGVTGNWRIYNNVFHDFTQGIFIETTGPTFNNVLIYNNVFYTTGNVTMPAIIFRAKLPTGVGHSWTNIVIANNDFIGMQLAAVRIFADPNIVVTLSGSRLENNIFYGNIANTEMNDSGEGTITWSSGGFVWNNNIFSSPQSIKYKAVNYSTITGFQAANPDCTGNLTVMPTLVNLVGHNYRLVEGSAGINAGRPEAEFSSDFIGVLRPQGPAWDIGAFEFVPGLQSPSQLRVSGSQ